MSCNSTNQTRQSRFSNDPNCSICRIVDGEPVIFGKTLYVTNDIDIDYSGKVSRVAFYEKNPGWHSLNQADGAIMSTLLIPLNIAFEILQAFQEVDNQNIAKLWKLYDNDSNKSDSNNERTVKGKSKSKSKSKSKTKAT